MVKTRSESYDGIMLSYLHGYHAGSAADVLKHSALIFCLEYLKQKEKPLLCVDTHAGTGFYDLAVMPNREWENGIGRLLCRQALPSMLAGYLKISGAEIETQGQSGTGGEPADLRSVSLRTSAAGSVKQHYYGSPLIMAKILEKGDRLVCFELHPREFEALNAAMAGCRKGPPTIEVRREDGPGGLKSLLPPPSRRGLVLIDPSWEEQGDYESIPRAVREGLKRFPEGTFIVWYPLLALPKKKNAVPLRDLLFDLPGEKRCRAELCTGTAGSSPRGMYGSGLVIFNPPWTLRPALEQTLPYLAKIVNNNTGGWRLDSDG